MNIQNYIPDNNHVGEFIFQEMRAEDVVINKLAIKESIGKNFEFANAKSLGQYWSDFRKDLPSILYFSKLSEISNDFVDYMRMNEKNKKKKTHFQNEHFYAEVFEFVSRKMVEENYLNNRIFSPELKRQAMRIILLPKLQSYICKGFSIAAKRINNKDDLEVIKDLKNQLINDFVKMFKSGDIKEIETNE